MSDEDDFESLMDQSGVIKLSDLRTVRQRRDADQRVQQRATVSAQDEFEQAMVALNAAPDKDARVPATRAPDRVLTLKLSKRARVHIDAQLDLHGLHMEEAVDRLSLFVGNAFVAGYRRVLVVTGKGRHSADGVSVLRPVVEAWIATDGVRMVAAFGEAPRAIGGSGALILEMRKRRSSGVSGKRDNAT